MRPSTTPRPAQVRLHHVERLRVLPDRRPGTFSARLEHTGEVIVSNSRQPLVDAARALLDLGFDPAALVTMCHQGKDNSFAPLPIGEWGKWTYTDSDRDGLRKVRFMPRQLHAGGQKSGGSLRLGPIGRTAAGALQDGRP